MNLQKIKNFFVKYKMPLGIGVMTVLLFLCNVWFPMWLISGSFLLLFMCVCSIKEIFCVMMYLELYTGLYGQYAIGVGAGLLVIIVRYIIDVVKKKKPVKKVPLILTVILIVMSSIINYSFNTDGLYSGLNFIFMFFLIYFVYIYHKDIDIASCFNYLLIGMLVTSALTGISLLFEEFGVTISYYDGYHSRLALFTLHFNFLSMLCLFELAYTIYSLFHKKRPLWVDLLAIATSVTLGFFTLSKAFILMLIFFIFYSIVSLIIKYKLKSIIYIFGVIIFIGIIYLIFDDYVYDIYQRFFLHFTEGTIITQITTGRSAIWYNYVEEIFSSPVKALFGVGIFSVDMTVAGPHNVYIYLLYRLGIVGSLLFIGLILSYVFSGKPWFKIRFNNCLLFFTWILLSLEEVVFSDKFLFFMLFSIIIMFKEHVDPEGYHAAVNKDKENEKQEIEQNEEKQTKESVVQELQKIDDKTENLDEKQKISEKKKYVVKSKKTLKS